MTDQWEQIFTAAFASRGGESVSKERMVHLLGGREPTAALRMAVDDFVGSLETLADITEGRTDIFIPQAQTGASCKCILSTDYGHPPVQQMALLMFATASYGVRMDHGDNLPLKEFVADVLTRVYACTDVILSMDKPT